MDCPQADHRLLDYLENQLLPEDRVQVLHHLEECAECRTLAEQLHALDPILAQSLARPELPAGFAARLHARLRSERRSFSEVERAERLRAAQAEFDKAMEGLNRGIFGLGVLRNVPGCAFLAALTGLVMCHLGHEFTGGAAMPKGGGLPIVWTFSFLVLLLGLAAAFPRPFKRFWTPS